MNSSLLFIMIRHLISIVIVVSLCAYYSYQTGRIFVWFFLPISLIPLVITLWDNHIRQKEMASDRRLEKKADLPNVGESDKK